MIALSGALQSPLVPPMRGPFAPPWGTAPQQSYGLRRTPGVQAQSAEAPAGARIDSIGPIEIAEGVTATIRDSATWSIQ